jgi:hypothetical protein
MKIFYGKDNRVIDITNICITKLRKNNIVIIPKGDLTRDALFTDPIPGIHKDIIIVFNDMYNVYDELTPISINVITNEVSIYNPMKNKKVAILFFGLTRTLGKTHTSIKENLLNPLSEAGASYDIFIHANKIYGEYTNPWSGEATHCYNNEDIDFLLNPKYNISDNQAAIINSIDFNNYYKKLGAWNDGMSEDMTKYLIRNMCLALYSKKQVTMLFDKNIAEYDYAVIIRPDMNIYNKIDINWYAELNDNNIIIPAIDWYAGCNDRFCIGKPNIVSYYGKLFDGLQEYSEQKSIVSERYLLDKLSEKGITIIQKSINYINLRI